MFTLNGEEVENLQKATVFQNISCLRLITLDVARDVIKKGFQNISCLRLIR